MTAKVRTSWCRTTGLGTTKFTYDGEFKTYTVTFTDMKHDAYQVLCDFLEVEQADKDAEAKDAANASYYQRSTAGERHVYRFSEKEVQATKDFFQNATEYKSWGDLKDHLQNLGFPIRSAETLYQKFRNDAEVMGPRLKLLHEKREKARQRLKTATAMRNAAKAQQEPKRTRTEPEIKDQPVKCPPACSTEKTYGVTGSGIDGTNYDIQAQLAEAAKAMAEWKAWRDKQGPGQGGGRFPEEAQ